MLSRFKLPIVYLSSAGYVYIGFLHFFQPNFFLKIMPPYLPFHLELVFVSGAIEIGLGVGLLFKRLRKYVGWGLILLLVAVYPANIYLAFNEVPQQAIGISSFMASWVRLPIQFLLIGLAYWFTKP